MKLDTRMSNLTPVLGIWVCSGQKSVRYCQHDIIWYNFVSALYTLLAMS